MELYPLDADRGQFTAPGIVSLWKMLHYDAAGFVDVCRRVGLLETLTDNSASGEIESTTSEVIVEMLMELGSV